MRLEYSLSEVLTSLLHALLLRFDSAFIAAFIAPEYGVMSEREKEVISVAHPPALIRYPSFTCFPYLPLIMPLRCFPVAI